MQARYISHMYWHRKEQFLLEQDRYAAWTLFAVESGRFRFKIQEHQGEAGAGDMVVCPPQTLFVREVIEPVSFHFFHYHVEECGAESVAPDVQGIGAGMWRILDEGRLSTTFRYIHAVKEREELARAVKLEHLLRDLLFLADEARWAEGVAGMGHVPQADERMEEARRWLDNHALRGSGIRDLATLLELTPVQLTRRFRAAHGINPQDYATELRIREAGRLLSGTRLALHEIAARCGYENGYYLSRVFRKKTGLNPSEYRKRYQV
ncbi:AraC family transcriptional regulator [Paenibacillus daejeonensis]|uniref:AraC family transcriptional regulator n=1 Tax=Paenibacillus daejeonensis TaxID=135193 RepID=UPI00036C9CEF|nr:AraC family transcriptional regulator [Paenibacillus daejeonensis]